MIWSNFHFAPSILGMEVQMEVIFGFVCLAPQLVAYEFRQLDYAM